MSHNVSAQLVISSPSVFSAGVGVPTVAAGDEAAPTFSLRIVDMSGSILTTLTNAEPDTVTWTLNQPDEAEFHFAKNAYDNTQVTVLGTSDGPMEAQIYRNSDLLFWGPITGIDVNGNDGKVTCKCSGVDWYLNRRFIDGTITNLLDNPDFESGTSDWTGSGSLDSFSIDSTTFETGSASAKLVNSTTGEDAYIEQAVTITAGAIGELISLSGWFYIESFAGEAHGGRGLYIEGSKAGVHQTDDFYPIEQATPRGDWIKALENGSTAPRVWIPPNETWLIRARCYAPHGTIYWDDLKLVKMESLGTALFSGHTLIATDIAYILGLIIRHLQNTTYGKSPLNIGYHTETTGTKLIKTYQFVDHVQFDQALQEMLDRNDGADYSIDLTPTTRTFHSYANKRGTDRSGDVSLEFARDPGGASNVTDYRLVSDGGACITRQTVLGEDNGPAREQGEAADASGIGGTILQDVRQAPHNAMVASLQPIADDRLDRYSEVPTTIDLDVMGDSGLIPTLKCGDLVNVTITDGWVNLNDTYRIMRMSLNCPTNILTVTVAQDSL